MVNIQDSRRRKQLTKMTVQDGAGMSFPSSKSQFLLLHITLCSLRHLLTHHNFNGISLAMKLISYLTMIFLPPSFAATVFGMNVTSLNPQSAATLGQYFALMVPLTMLTTWIVIALEIDIKEVRVHQTSRRTRTKVFSDTKQSKPSRHSVGKGHDGETRSDSDELESEDESVDRVEVRYICNHFDYKNRVPAREGETETVRGLDIWARLSWPLILLSTALDERRRRRKRKARMGRAGRKTE